jgi:hypothetical protein
MSKKHKIHKISACESPSSFVQRTEFIVGVLLTLTAVFIHFTFLRYAGGFWRDEVNSIAMAGMPSLSDIVYHLKYDSFPILLSIILRLWSWMVGGNEWGLRVFGLMVGICTLGVLWLNGRWLGYRVPLWSLALFAFNPLAFQIGDSIRPHGLGTLLALLAFGLIWQVTQQARSWNVIAGTIVLILNVQCLYTNGFFVLTIVFAGMVISLYNRHWKRAVLLGMMGMTAAISILPYYPIMKQAGKWAFAVKREGSFSAIWGVLSSALNASSRLIVVWEGLFILGICVFCFYYLRVNRRISKLQQEKVWFCAITVVLYAVMFLGFLRIANITTSPWHYLPLIAVTAVFGDVLWGDLAAWNKFRIILAFLTATTLFKVDWRTVHTRQTNIDMVASTMKSLTSQNDLIVLYPWWYGVSFQHYYQGPAPFTTLPFIEDHRIHRYDLYNAKMASRYPMEPVFSEISDVFKSGGSVWVVGVIEQFPVSSLDRYVRERNINHITGQKLPPLTDKPVNPYENASILKLQGQQ